MSDQLKGWLEASAPALDVPGVAVGVYHEGTEHYAFHGVTSVENPLPVDEDTIFLYGSTQKTYTATAIMILVDRGLVELEAPVRTYVPELRLKDESVARDVTVLQILNHTAGWQGDAREDCGEGDDALERFVASMVKLEQVTPLGAAFSYNNAALNLAGRVIEKVTGQTYESAMGELVYEPLGLTRTFIFPGDVMTRRFALGHQQDADGTIKVRRPWQLGRCSAAAGGFGVSSTIGDQIAWARFHLGDGTSREGKRILSEELLPSMQRPTFDIAGSALGDAVGISWFLRSVDGVTAVAHGGDVIGQHSSFLMVPERDFAVAVFTNCDSIGSQLKEDAVRFALTTYLGIVDREPEPVARDDEALAPFTGRYETVAATVDITAENGGLVLNVEIKPAARAELFPEDEDVPEQPPIPIGMLAGDEDRYIVTGGAAKGMKGYFVRGADGTVESVHVGGRLATRVKDAVGA